MLTYRTGAASRSGGKAMATYLLESTIAPGAGELARYYYAGARSLSPEAQEEREIVRAVATGSLPFDDAVAALTEQRQAHVSKAGSAASERGSEEGLLRAMGRAVAEGFIDFDTAEGVIAERLMTEMNAGPIFAEEQAGRRFAAGELRAADLEPLWFETEGRRLVEAGATPDALYAARDAFIARVLASAEAHSEREETIREQARDRLADAAGAYQSGMETVAEQVTAELRSAVEAYRHGLPAEPTTAELRHDMDPGLAKLLAIDPHRALNADELAHLLGGQRADGKPIEGASKSKRIGFIDLCWSADKSVSLAWAFAAPDEQAEILQAHRESVAAAMESVGAELGWARKGAGGRDGADAGHTTWIKFDHYTARPTLEIAAGDHTELVQMPIAADPNLHSHVAMLNVVLTDGGRVGSLDMQRLQGHVHEWGALYQAYLAQNLRKLGADVVLDRETGAARVTAIPDRVRAQFSKRTLSAEQIAKKWAAEGGRDWNTMSAAEKIELAHRGAGSSRRSKDAAAVETEGDLAAWRKQAQEIGWTPKSVLASGPVEVPKSGREERHEIAYTAALPWVEKAFARSAVIDMGEVRVAATRGLIAAGVDGPDDTDAVVARMFERGIRQEGEQTQLIAVRDGGHLRVTTELHLKREEDLVAMARAAGADRSTALAHESIEQAIRRSGLDFSSEHGRQQRAVIDHLGTGGRLGVAIGVGGAGKTSLLTPLVDAWRQDGRAVYGAAIAWRQTDDLADAGIEHGNRFALSVLLEKAERGDLRLDRKAVVVVDELGAVGTADMRRLLTLQSATGAQVVAVGDDRQMQSIEAGPVIDLLRRALGPEQVPELLSTVRQQTQRERETSLMFREGRAAEALERKQADGTLHVVPGGYRDAVERVADLAMERRLANAADPKYRLTISAPTNADARAIGTAIRQRRRAMGEIESDKITLPTIDQTGATYELPLAVGDRVRLFANARASFGGGKAGNIGRNGSVLDVLGIEADGITLRNARGTVGKVRWQTLTDRATGRVRLTYGDALTTSASQGATSTEHIDAVTGGTKAVNAYSAYVGQSRHRRASFLVTSDGAERQEITARRPIGDPRPVTPNDVLANMARNLSRQPEKASALALLDTEATPKEPAMSNDTTRIDTAYLDRLRQRSEELRREEAQSRRTVTVPSEAYAKRLQQRAQQDEAKAERAEDQAEQLRAKAEAERAVRRQVRGMRL